MATLRGTVVRAGRALERFAEHRPLRAGRLRGGPRRLRARLAGASAASGSRPAPLPPRLRAALRRPRRLPDGDPPADAGHAARRRDAPRGRAARRRGAALRCSTRSRSSRGSAWRGGTARYAAVATAVALLAYPGYVLLFHELASDALFAAAFALVALLVVRVAEAPTLGRSVALGLGIVGLVLARPVGQALVLLVLVPLVAAHGARARRSPRRASRRRSSSAPRARRRHNAVRADDFAVVRGGSASLLFRTFVADRIVEPENGACVARSSREPSREGCSRTSRTARAGSISRRSSPPGARGCTTT